MRNRIIIVIVKYAGVNAGAGGADVDAGGAGKARCCGKARRYGMLVKVTVGCPAGIASTKM